MHLVNRTFDEISIGDCAELRRLIKLDDLYSFAAVSGNYNPMHLPDYDGDGDGRNEHTTSAAFLASLISAVLGTRLPGPGTVCREQQVTFHAPAHAGDEVICRVEVVDKLPDGVLSLRTSLHNLADGVLLMEGASLVDAPTHKFDQDGVQAPGLLVQRHRHFETLLEQARPLDPIATAIVCPDDPKSLGGALRAAEETLITPIFVGVAADIQRAADQLGASLKGYEIIDIAGDRAAAQRACVLVHEGRANALMKGHLHTDDLLRPMLDKEAGLRAGRRFTHVFVMDVPGREEPLLVTDAAINISPDLATKVDITQNAIDLARSIGLTPRAGVLSAVETVTPAIQSSLDAALLSKMADRGQIKDGAVEGPLAMDNAVDLGAARTKGLTGEVAGRANILVVPDIDAGNMVAKQLSFISHAEGAGLVLGAKVPVILNSRSDSPASRLASCAVAALHHAAQSAKLEKKTIVQ